MNDTDRHETTAEGEGGSLSPQQAQALLTQTQREANRQFDINSWWLSLVQAVVVLVAFGALWLSVRGQHPYKGPNAGVIALVYAVVAVSVTTVARVASRATRGVSGPSVRQMRIEAVTVVVAFIATYTFMGALKADGAPQSIVYGVFPAVGPFIIVGAAMAGISAAKEDWLRFGVAIPVVMLAAISAFAGPVGAWLAMGIGLSVIVLGYAATQRWQERRA